MYKLFIKGNDIVVPSRFIEGGEMKDCPLIKSILVRVGNFTLFQLSNIGEEILVMALGYFQIKLLKNILWFQM